jgi:pimeloyl-ACP methyl ester carboxylesterase
MKSSQHFMKLASILSDTFTVYVPDRRGRGLSGPNGDNFSVTKEVEDLQALINKTNTRNIFGLSSGALVTLRTALGTPLLQKIALYEPPLSLQDSVPIDWLPRYEREIRDGKLAAALTTALKGLQVEPIFEKIPRFILVPLMTLAMKFQPKPKGDDLSIRSLIPTHRFDMRIVKEMADTLADYHSLQTQCLLLRGTDSPAFFGVALDSLTATLPHSHQLTFQNLGHDGPEDDGQPEEVAKALRQFFSET